METHSGKTVLKTLAGMRDVMMIIILNFNFNYNNYSQETFSQSYFQGEQMSTRKCASDILAQQSTPLSQNLKPTKHTNTKPQLNPNPKPTFKFYM